MLFILRRVLLAVSTILATTFIVFMILELDPEGVASKLLGQFVTPKQKQIWLVENRYYKGGDAAQLEEIVQNLPKDEKAIALSDEVYIVLDRKTEEPISASSLKRYFSWLTNILQGDLGYSYRYKTPVNELIWSRAGNTLILAGLAMLLMIPISLAVGVLAGMREGSITDRILSTISIITTSVPEFASAVIFVAIFVYWLEWLPGASIMIDGFDWLQIILPVTVLVTYAAGYISRITRASMSEVMRAPYIRTAYLKGLSYRDVVLKHALRNALITPVTVIMLQIPWLLNGVIVVEYFFAYKGFGSLVWEAAQYEDVYLLEACTVLSVLVVVSTQFIADICYSYLNPRIRFS